MKRSISIQFLLLIGLFSDTGHAATVLLDFNDAATGNLPGQSGLGTGTTGSWGGSTDIDVVAGDLTAPASTNYSVTQSRTAQSIRGGTNARQATIALSTPLTGNTIWGSFLINLNGQTSGGRGGITLNPTLGSNPADPRIFVIDDDVQAWLTGNSGAEAAITSSAVSASTTALILFQIEVADTGNDTINLWLNPDVTNIGSADANHSSTDFLGAGGISTLGIFSYNGGIPTIDNVRLSDDADAFLKVTAIPEPSTFLLVGVAGLAVLMLRRYR